MGFMAITAEDDAFVIPTSLARRACLPVRPFGVGDSVRDWSLILVEDVVFPYDEVSGTYVPCEPLGSCLEKHLWPFRTTLQARNMFGKSPEEHGLKWYEYLQFIRNRVSARLLIVFAFVATHNHFVLDRGGKVFKQSAPVIKLPPEATEDDHLALLGLLNSSTACFWLKQVMHNKGSTVDERGARQRTTPFEDFWEYDGTKLKQFPVVDAAPLELARALDQLAQELRDSSPSRFCAEGTPTYQQVSEASARYLKILSRMIALQEELDWACYRSYGVCDEDLTFGSDPPDVELGERPFEIQMARRIEARVLETTWFERHGSKPVMVIPERWPEDYQRLAKRRIEAILRNPNLALIEAPEFKRRWNVEHWELQLQRALRGLLLDRLEALCGTRAASLSSCAQLTESAARDSDFCDVSRLYRNWPDYGLLELITDLVLSEAVPFLPVLRYKPSALAKRTQWEKTWELQRLEDAGNHKGTIQVPPKYAAADFLNSSFWRLRGKLDVPKERFILFPHCERTADRSPVFLWAGFNHLQRAQAIAAYYLDMKDREGWTAERLTPLLAGIAEVVPWVKQWHNDPDPEHGERMGDYFAQFLADEATALGLTIPAIRAWRPPSKKDPYAIPEVEPA
ncbi:MAG: BREX-2 system adenine-specific DNA-methyltransferase PglX [Vicinamibacteria bacterium]